MANYNSLKSTINSNIRQNGTNAITGQLLQSVLNAMVNSLGSEYQFVGVASTNTNPGTPDYNVAYLAGPGTYQNFGNIVVPANNIAILRYNGAWVADTMAFPSGTTIAWTQIVTSGTKIATVTINGTPIDVYAPSGGGGGGGGSVVSFQEFQLTGTKIATITIDGVATDIYAPAAGGAGYQPNGEDIDLNANNQLQFANRTSATGRLGYVIVRSNSSISSQLTNTNTIYEIRYNFNLNGGTLTLPSGSVLYFNGGSIQNGKIIINGNRMICHDGCFRSVTIQIANGGVPIPGIGLSSYFTGDSEKIFESLCSFSEAKIVSNMTINDLEVSINHNFVLDGDGHTITITKSDDRGQGVESYAFISVGRGGYNITIKNLKVISRSAVFGTTVSGSAFGYRGAFLQSIGNHVVIDNVLVDTTGTALTTWGEKGNAGGYTILDSTLLSRMFDFEGNCDYISAYNSTFSINANDDFYYLCDVLSYFAEKSFFENCNIFGGIEFMPYTDVKSYLTVSKCLIDDCFRIGNESGNVPLTALIEDCIQDEFITNTNRLTGGKYRRWGGIVNLTFRNNELNISSPENEQYDIYFFISQYKINNITFENNRFVQKLPSRYQVEALIRIDTAVDNLKFDGNFISSNRETRLIVISNITLSNIVGVNNSSGQSTPQYHVYINSTQYDGIIYNLFPIKRSGVSSARPSLQTMNIGFIYYDTTLNKPIFWSGSVWYDASGSVIQ